MPLVLYVSAKFVAYVAWCFLGLRWARFQGSPGSSILKALALGAARLVIGWVVGIGVGLAAVFLFRNLVAAYFLILVPVRWLEWSAISPWIFTNATPAEDDFRATAVPALSRWWRLGGIVLSCAVDVGFIVHGGGFPSGRVFC